MSARLAFAGRGRDLVVALEGAVDVDELHRAIAIFMPGWPVSEAARDTPADITVAMRGTTYVVSAASWAGGESLADDTHNAANALAGLLIDALARRQPLDSDTRTPLLDRAIAGDRQAVALAPSSAFPWMRLVQAQVEKRGLTAEVAPLLRMSYRTAPNDPRLLLPRLDIAMALWNELPDDVREMTNGQIRLAMEWFPIELARQTRLRHRLAEVRAALAVEPEKRARFDLIYLLRRDVVS